MSSPADLRPLWPLAFALGGCLAGLLVGGTGWLAAGSLGAGDPGHLTEWRLASAVFAGIAVCSVAGLGWAGVAMRRRLSAAPPADGA